MGTSSDHRGGLGPAWSRARSQAGAWAAAGGGDGAGGVASVVAGAARALAGALTPAAAAPAESLARLGGLAAASSGPGGLPRALEDHGLADLIGRPPAEVQAALVDFLAGDPTSRDADAVRLAAEQVVAQLMEDAADLDAIVVDEERAEHLLETFLAAWLARLILRELGTSLVDPSPAAAEERSQEVREYIAARLRFLLKDRRVTQIDWASPPGQQIARETIRGAMEVFRESDGPS